MRAMALAVALAAGPATAGEARFDWFDYRGEDPTDRAFRPVPGEYRNPILAGFHADPSIVRVGDDYYLAVSTFAYFPGIALFHSRDLVNWTQIGNAIDRPEQLDFAGLGLSQGVFAPDISWRDGVFYILNTCVGCGGNFVITAKDARGPWSDPVWIPEVNGIDPSFFFDEDGRTYLLNNGPPEGAPLYGGHRAIWMQEFDLAALKAIGPRKVLVNGGVDILKKPSWIEGPRLYRRDGWYYLTCAEGGTGEQHSQVVFRSREVWGPYVPYPGAPILTQRHLPEGRTHPVTSAGHADLVETAAGEWWATFLATRPYADDHYNTGRETFLLPVRWKDGWPRILDGEAAIPQVRARPNLPPGPAPKLPTNGAFAYRDEFEGAVLAPQWMTLRTPKGRWSRLGQGALVLTARSAPLGARSQPSYLGRRQQHAHAEAATRVAFAPTSDGDRAGLAALQSEDFFYLLSVAREDGRAEVRLERRGGAKEPPHGARVAAAPVPEGHPVELKITARGGRYDFAYALEPGRWISLAADQDGTLLSTKTAGGFVGATFGLYAYSAEPSQGSPR